MDVLLLLPLCLARCLELGQFPPDRTRLLGAEVEGEVRLVLVELPEVGALLRGDDGVDTSDSATDTSTVRR